MDSTRQELMAWLKANKIPLRVALQLLHDEDNALKDRVKRREKMVENKRETRDLEKPGKFVPRSWLD